MPVGYMVLASIFLYHYWHSMGDMVIITPGAFTSHDIFLVPVLTLGPFGGPLVTVHITRTHRETGRRIIITSHRLDSEQFHPSV